MPEPSAKKLLMYFIICVAVRAGLAGAATYIELEQDSEVNRGIFAAIYFLFALNAVIQFFRYRRSKGKQLGLFKQKVWWNNFRLVHAFFWTLYAILILVGINEDIEHVYIILWASLFVGIAKELQHRLPELLRR